MFSYHYPIILVTTQIKWGPTPFRSLDVWLSEPSFLKTFKREWVQLGGLALEQKLKRIKKPLKEWNKVVFGRLDQKIKAFQQELQKLDSKAQVRMLLEQDWLRKEALQSQLWLWMLRSERYWKQISRCKIIKEGDRNTKFFHLKASFRRQRKVIDKILVNDLVVSDPDEIKAHIIRYFKELYRKQRPSRFNLSVIR